jgi:hypothetical protein
MRHVSVWDPFDRIRRVSAAARSVAYARLRERTALTARLLVIELDDWLCERMPKAGGGRLAVTRFGRLEDLR